VTWLGQQTWADTSRLCCAGFCVGGGAALRWADGRPAEAPAPAVAVFYGRPLETLRGLRGPVLGVFGTQDNQFPAAQVRSGPPPSLWSARAACPAVSVRRRIAPGVILPCSGICHPQGSSTYTHTHARARA